MAAPPSKTSPTPQPTASPWNVDFVESMHDLWRRDPDQLPETWQMFFQGFELSMCGRDCVAATRANAQFRIANLIAAFRSRGHMQARLDPLGDDPTACSQCSLEAHGFGDDALDQVFDTGTLHGPPRATLRQIAATLHETYCGSVGVEYMHIQDLRVRAWLQAQMEPIRNRPHYDGERKLEILERLIDAHVFETFLHRRFLGQKRFSLEGAETFIPAVHAVVELAPELGVEEVVMGMAHRGRLNVLANILDKSYAEIFYEFESPAFPDTPYGDADVKYHKGFESTHTNRQGQTAHISLAANPSHLEAVDPVVQGRARARQRQMGGTHRRRRVLPLLVHGDAAFAGQGIVAETLNLSQLPGYQTGGTLHFIINNRIGFTTLPGESRSTPYATDVARMVEAPIFHVNGDDPEAVCFASELALRFRQEFGRDVVVDLNCYRRHGHNEGDEPAFTQPALYRRIARHDPVRVRYTRQLIEEGTLDPRQEAVIHQRIDTRLQRAFEQVKVSIPLTHLSPPDPQWRHVQAPPSPAPVDTAVPHGLLLEVARASTSPPDGFHLHRKLARALPARLEAVAQGGLLDWSLAETLAFGSLLRQGVPVRLSGQDSARGTFSQRHAVWYDQRTEQPWVPLDHIHPQQARFQVYNSSLSEASVLGFDYGFSLADPSVLILWEAQFGDFVNGAQHIIDQFIVAAQAKWGRSSGLVMLLPHGYEGQGPEHSNAYLDRFLAACAEDNIQVVNPTTPAQYFHLLRRQMLRPFRRPLVVMAPKSLLRLPAARSPVAALTGGGFQPVLDDPAPPPAPTRLVLCSGKLYYDLAQARQAEDQPVALVRVEQLYPFPAQELARVAARYAHVQRVVWAQEEPANRGAWGWIHDRLQPLFTPPVRYVGRPASASPATGSHRTHQRQQAALVARVLDPGADPV